MKRFFTLFILALLTGTATLRAQNIFTVVYADSYDGFVNVRSQPSNQGRILTQLYEPDHGLGGGVLLGQQGGWLKVRVGTVTGWAYGKYVGRMTWYTGQGKKRLVASKPNTPLFLDDFSGEKPVGPVFTTVDSGTILADEFDSFGNYYVLMTAHDNLYVRMTDVRVEVVR